MHISGAALGKFKATVRISPGKQGQMRGRPLSLRCAWGFNINTSLAGAWLVECEILYYSSLDFKTPTSGFPTPTAGRPQGRGPALL